MEKIAASALLKQFETVAYTSTDFLPRSQDFSSKDVDSLPELRMPFLELIGGLQALGPDVPTALAKIYSAVLVGAKDFAPPQGLGAVHSRKCYVGILASGAPANVEPDFRRASYESIQGRRAWTWSIPPSEGDSGPTQFYAAQVGGSYFVLANNREDFQETATALTSVQGFKPTSISVPGWDTFSKYRCWLFRSIRRGGVTNAMAAGTYDLPQSVTALASFADVDNREGAVLVFTSDKSMETVPKIFRASQLNQLQPQGDGVWQAKIPLSRDEAAFDALFEVFGRFGFGVYL